jgi:hypothetical protein
MILSGSIFPPKLAEYLAARECVAFVGAGFSVPCGMPSWAELLGDLLEEAAKSITTPEEDASLKDCRHALEASFFLTAASGVRDLLSKEQLRNHLIGAFDGSRMRKISQNKQRQMLARMENLVLGPWAGIITTNYDNLIENAFDRFAFSTPPFRCDGSQNSLGNVLCLPLSAGKFFVKLHGDTWADSQVLSTADYVHTWMTSPRVRHFLTSIMLRYRLVFIGCSLEDAMLRLRFGLWAAFGKALPKAYAVLPDTSTNRLRRRELKEDGGLESLLYPVAQDGSGHEMVDEFLSEARKCADYRHDDPEIGTLGVLKSRTIPERFTAIGAINRHLLGVISRQEESRLKYARVFDPDFEQVPQGRSRHVLSSLSEGERLYRLFFLVSLHLLQEQSDNGTEYFTLPVEILAHLSTEPLIDGV